nr:hypothetical protein [Fischerella sp. PCC 9605]
MSRVFVTEEELTVRRTPQELVEWFEHKFQEITQQEGGKEAIRMREGLCKEFIEEVCPLSIFASFRFGGRNNVTLQPVIGNQNYDVLITDCAFSPPHVCKLEITQAHEGENDFLRRLMLQKQGWTPISGPIMKTGTKNTGIELRANIVTRDVEDYQNKQINLIIKALKGKIRKKYESDTSLLIMFWDLIEVNETDVREALYRVVEDELEPRKIPFSALYLASWSKRIFLRWPPNNDG